MKSIDQLLSHLHALDIKLWVEGDRLRYQAPPGSLNPALRAELIEKKADLMAILRQTHGPDQSAAPRNSDEKPPLSFAQQRLWFLDQLEGKDATAYLIPAALRLTGALSVPALLQALQEVIHRHEVLRTAFIALDGQPVQVIAVRVEPLVPMIDLSGLSPEEREQEARRRAQENARTGFDLSQGPLIRFAILKLDSEEHVLLVNMHHIVSDGWSIGILVKEIVTLYAANVESRENPLPPLPIQYADYAMWQRSRLTGDVLQEQIDYWRKQLAGLPPLLALPLDFARPAAQTFGGQSHAFTLDAELTKQLNALSQKSGATLFMTLVSAFAALLGRCAGQTDLAVGTPIAGRTRKEIEDLIGLFVNILVIRTNLENNPTFMDLLEHMKQTCLDAYAHQDVPFERLVDELKPERSLSHSPLFQVMFMLQNNQEPNFRLSGLQIASLKTEDLTAKFDLTLTITEHEGRLYASLEYNTDLFRPETIERMAGHLRILLEGIVSNPEASVNTLPLMTEDEYKQIVDTYNSTEADYPKDRCVHQLFEKQVHRTPEAVALVFEDQALTYDQLNHRSNRLAHYLRTLGVGPDTLVGICMERSLEVVIGLLGILKAGGAYVPLDPEYPQERIAFMLEDSKAKVLLTQSKLSSVISHRSSAQHPSSSSFIPKPSSFNSTSSSINIVYLDADWKDITEPPSHNPKTEVHPGNLAYVIYTSGSTGIPKGVCVEHGNLSPFLWAMRHAPGLEEEDRLLALTTIAFDIAALELYLPLTAGAQIELATAEDTRDALRLSALLVQHSPTVIQATPATWRMLLAGGWRGNGKLKLLCGGEALSYDLGRDLAACSQELWNFYGPTEATVWATLLRITPDAISYQKTGCIIPIGRPIANTRVYILDGNGNPNPIGVAGELCIGGVQVARGYLNRPELTAEKFIPDPFSANPDARLYKTGDLARYLPDGGIEYLRRMDFQVKIRGFRIEMGEIEAALMRHAGVREAVVLVREDHPGDKRLAAYVVPAAKDTPPDSSTLRMHLKASLPEYMIPTAFAILDSLPLTPNGKVDRRALPAPEYQASLETYVAPRNETEQKMAVIWCEVLGVPQVGIHDNFFDLGGHSLLTIRLLERLRQKEMDTTLRILFANPVLADLANAVNSQTHKVEVPPNRIPDFGKQANGSLKRKVRI